MVYVSVSQQLGLDAGGTPLEMLLLSSEHWQALGHPSAGGTCLAQVPEASLSPAHTNHSGAGWGAVPLPVVVPSCCHCSVQPPLSPLLRLIVLPGLCSGRCWFDSFN